MGSIANALVVGNLTRDPEVRDAAATRVCNVTLAVNQWVSKKEHTSFIECVLFGRMADTVADFCRKGSQLLVSGELRMEQWDDKETGQKRSKLKVIAEKMQLMGSRSDSTSSRRGSDDQQGGGDHHPAESDGQSSTWQDGAADAPF